MMVAAGLIGPASAADPYSIAGAQSFGYDNNLLRLGNGSQAPEGYSRADNYSITTLQGGIDQAFGRQRLAVDLSLRNVRYSGNSIFNNQGYTGSIGLDWSTVERLSGRLSANTNRSLSGFNSYEIGLLREKNYEDAQGLNASVNVGLVTQYSLEVTASHREVNNSLQNQSLQARNFKQESGSVGLRWQPRPSSSIGLSLRHTQGKYPKFRQVGNTFQADRYKQEGVEVSARLQPSGASLFDARVAQSRTRYDLNDSRSFSGITGSAGWAWQPTGKLRLNTRFTRDTGQDSYAVTVFSGVPGSSDSSRLVNSLRLDLSYDLSSKVSFTTAWQAGRNSVVQTIENPLLPVRASGEDRSSVFSVGARWTPTRSVTTGCDAAHEDRKATGDIVISLSSASFSCFAQLQLNP